MTKSLKRVDRAARKSWAARAAFEHAIRDASADGESMRAIAAAAGLSHQRVHQILHGR